MIVDCETPCPCWFRLCAACCCRSCSCCCHENFASLLLLFIFNYEASGKWTLFQLEKWKIIRRKATWHATQKTTWHLENATQTDDVIFTNDVCSTPLVLYRHPEIIAASPTVNESWGQGGRRFSEGVGDPRSVGGSLKLCRCTLCHLKCWLILPSTSLHFVTTFPQLLIPRKLTFQMKMII